MTGSRRDRPFGLPLPTTYGPDNDNDGNDGNDDSDDDDEDSDDDV